MTLIPEHAVPVLTVVFCSAGSANSYRRWVSRLEGVRKGRPSRKLWKGVQGTGRDESKLCISWIHDLKETYEGVISTCGVFGRRVECQKMGHRFSGTIS